MSAESDVKRYRGDSVRLRGEIGKASTTVATNRKKAAAASSAATKSKSASTAKMKLSEAERATKAANDAEGKRADLEKKLAGVEGNLAKALEKYEKERESKRDQAMKQLQNRADEASRQFAAPRVLAGTYGATVSAGPATSSAATEPGKDVFLSHASEDKDEIARPLRDALEARGVSVWFDEIQIKVGQSIRQEIERGIAGCRFGVVIISQSFFAKQWTNAELDALFSKKMVSGQNLVLPIWHHISKDEVLAQSALLAGISALNSATMTVAEIADALADVVREQGE
jgi:Skp family chaperone for outer membrane proteins